MSILHVQTLAFPEAALLQWTQGNYNILRRLHASSFLRRILHDKVRNRARPGRRFFGEAFVATQMEHERGWYGSFKWFTSWPTRQASPYGVAYRAALMETFPSIAGLSSRAFALCNHLAGKKPVPPDLWLIVDGEHRFIEVKLSGDPVRPTQIAGLALIATCLSRKHDVSAWIYNLYPERGQPDALPASVHAQYKHFCRICRRPNKRLHPTAPGEIMRRRG